LYYTTFGGPGGCGLLEKEYKQKILYTYSIEHLPHKDKVLFFYGLKGRNSKQGVVGRLNIHHVGRCVLLVPPEAEKEFDAFLQKWNCPNTKTHVMVAS